MVAKCRITPEQFGVAVSGVYRVKWKSTDDTDTRQLPSYRFLVIERIPNRNCWFIATTDGGYFCKERADAIADAWMWDVESLELMFQVDDFVRFKGYDVYTSILHLIDSQVCMYSKDDADPGIYKELFRGFREAIREPIGGRGLLNVNTIINSQRAAIAMLKHPSDSELVLLNQPETVRHAEVATNRHRFERIPVNFRLDVNDNVGVYFSTVTSISRTGLFITDLPQQVNLRTELSAVLIANGEHHKLKCKFKHAKVQQNGQLCGGAKITAPSREWVEFVISEERRYHNI